MRAIVRAAVAACLFLLPSVAAGTDLGGRIAEPAADEGGPAHNRTGAYVGLVGGYDMADLQAAGFSFADGSLMAGGFAGFNARLQGFVLGVEGDYLWTNVKGSIGSGLNVSSSSHYLASLRARAGVPLGPVLLYATGGPAFTNVDTTIGAATSNDFLVGAAFGGGVETEIGKTLFVRLEALHYAFPDQSVGLLQSHNQQTTVRVGLGFKLN